MTEMALQIGESFIGSGANAAHINTVFGLREGPAGVAWATALATPTQGHVPFMAVLKPSLPVKPVTLFVTKAAPANDTHGVMIWGAAQAGVASGVADAVAEGFISKSNLDNSCIIAAVWVNPEANDADEIYRNNRLATKNALENGSKNLPSVEEVLDNRALPHNPYYTAKE